MRIPPWLAGSLAVLLLGAALWATLLRGGAGGGIVRIVAPASTSRRDWISAT
jgi:hypothetical protein